MYRLSYKLWATKKLWQKSFVWESVCVRKWLTSKLVVNVQDKKIFPWVLQSWQILPSHPGMGSQVAFRSQKEKSILSFVDEWTPFLHRKRAHSFGLKRVSRLLMGLTPRALKTAMSGLFGCLQGAVCAEKHQIKVLILERVDFFLFFFKKEYRVAGLNKTSMQKIKTHTKILSASWGMIKRNSAKKCSHGDSKKILLLERIDVPNLAVIVQCSLRFSIWCDCRGSCHQECIRTRKGTPDLFTMWHWHGEIQSNGTFA